MARIFVANKLGFGSIFKRVKNGKPLSNLYVKFRGREYPVGSPRAKDAERKLCQLKGDDAHQLKMRTQGKAPSVLVGELLDDVVADYLEKKQTVTYLKIYIEKHLRPIFGDGRAKDLTTADLKSYVRARQREGAANATINRELAALRRGYKLALRHSPKKVDVMPHFEMLREDNVRTGFLSQEQYRRLKPELPPYLRPLLVVAFHVGNRRGELVDLVWDRVEFAAGIIRFETGTTKNKEGREVPILSGEMRECLIEQKGIHDEQYPKCRYVFHKEGQRLGNFSKAWASACKRAGVPELLLHDLRRSAVRNLSRAGVSRKVAREITGHKTESVYDRYDIVDAQDLKEAAAKLTTYLNGGS